MKTLTSQYAPRNALAALVSALCHNLAPTESRGSAGFHPAVTVGPWRAGFYVETAKLPRGAAPVLKRALKLLCPTARVAERRVSGIPGRILDVHVPYAVYNPQAALLPREDRSVGAYL